MTWQNELGSFTFIKVIGLFFLTEAREGSFSEKLREILCRVRKIM